MPDTRVVCTASGGGRTVLNLLDSIESGALHATIPLVIVDRECAAVERCAARGLAVELLPWTKGTTPEDWAARAWPRIAQSSFEERSEVPHEQAWL